MLRLSFACGSLASVLVLAGACGGGTSAAPARGGPSDPDAGTVVQAASGLPCDVDKVLADNCRKCHAAPPQFGSPMPLVTWDDLHAAAPTITGKKVHEAVVDRIASDERPMPPAPNAPLSEADRKVLSDWSLAGGPRSDADCTNTTKPVTEGVSCTPNLSLEPESAWEMPDSAGDEYVCWGVDLARDPATHITAFAPKIDNTKIVHHVVVYEAPSSYSRKPQPCSAGSSLSWRMVLGWAPGIKGFELPEEVGFPISADPSEPTHYVVQMHYSNPQKLAGEKDKSSIDLCTSPPRKYEADVMAFGSQDFTIPAAPPPGGAYTLDCALTVPAAFSGLHLFAAMPHMHKLGVAMTTTLTPKDGGQEVDLGTMTAFSFDAQAWLPIDATTKAGDVIRTKCSWANSTGEPVPFGEDTAQEMCYSFTMYYPRIKSSLWSWAAPASGPPLGAACK